MARLQQKRSGIKRPNLHDGSVNGLMKGADKAIKKRGIKLKKNFWLHSSIKKTQIMPIDSLDYEQLNAREI